MLPAHGESGDWIVKTPDDRYPGLVANEAAMMRLAGEVGIEAPEVHVRHYDQVDGLGEGVWPSNEDEAYVVRRFDRSPGGRIHIEDFAQVLGCFGAGEEKYRSTVESLAAIAYRGRDHASLREMVRRTVFNLLIGNGDAHLKNWSLIYRTPNKPRLAPAYDLASTVAWTQHDQTIALNMAGTKRFDAIGPDTFNAFFQRFGLPGQVREELLAEGRSTTRRVQDVWGQLYEGNGVPVVLIQRIEAHIRSCPLRVAIA